MAIITSSTNLSSVSYTAGEIIDIKNGATLTYNTQHTVRPGTTRCITSGKFRIENTSTTTPLVYEMEDMNRDLVFQSNGVFEIRGAMMEIGTGTGASQIFDFSTLYSGKLTDITYVEVETAPSSGVYFPWHIVEIAPKYYNIGRTVDKGSFPGAFDQNQEVFFWHSGIRQLSTGDGVNGKPVPSGCKIRIPNILITNQDWQLDTTFSHRIVSEGTPTGGTFTITITNRRTGATLGTTAALAFNATAAQIDTAVEAVLGAGTVSNSGGPLPSNVSITLAGAYANTPLAFQVNSSVTGGTNSVIYSVESGSGNLSLLNLTPSGTVDAECCMFSRKIRSVSTAFSKQRYYKVGFGGDAVQAQSSNGTLEYDHVNFTPNVYTGQGQNIFVSAVYGTVKFNKVVVTQGSGQTAVTIQVAPNCTHLDDIRVMNYGNRTSTAGIALNMQTLPNIPINRLRVVGGRTSLANLTGNIIVSPSVCDDCGTAQLTANATNAIVIGNSKDLTFVNLTKSGTAACRNQLFNVDTQSSNIKIIGGTYDCSGNSSGVVAPNGDNVQIINFNASNLRAAPSFVIDAPTSYATKNIVAKKCLATTVSGGIAIDSAQDAVLDMVSGTTGNFVTANISVQNFVGGNFADPGLTPTTGHVTFGAFGSGNGMTTTGTAYTSQTGNVTMPSNADTFIAELNGMHAITSFQNANPQFVVEGYGVFANLHRIINEGVPTGGTFTISVYNTSNVLVGTTSALAANASTSTIDAALEAIVGAGVAVSGTMGGGFSITMPTAYVCRLDVDGSALTGGTEPGVLYVLGRAVATPLITNMGTNFAFDFQVRNGGETTWGGTWTSLTGANLSSAISALTGYNANTTGLDARIRVTAINDDKYRNVSQISLLTNIAPSSWIVEDSTLTIRGANPTDVVELRLLSDDSLIKSFTGSGLKTVDIGTSFGQQAYFIRKTSGGIEIMRTQSIPFTLSIGSLGTFDLFFGAEVQLAESPTVTQIAEDMLTLPQIEASTILAKEATVQTRATNAGVWAYSDTDRTLTGSLFE